MAQDILIRVLADTTRATTALQRLTQQAESMARQIRAAVMGLLGGLSAQASIQAYNAATRVIGRVQAAAGQFSLSLREDLLRTSREVAAELATTADIVAQTIGDLEAAGLPMRHAMESVADVLRYARAAGVEAGVAARQLTQIALVLGWITEDAERTQRALRALGDLLIAAGREAVTTPAEIAEAMMGQAARAARAAGQDIVELVAAMTMLARVGRTGSVAGKTYATLLRELESSALRASAAWQQLGVTVSEAGRLRPLSQIMQELGHVLRQMPPLAQQTTLAMLGLDGQMASLIVSLSTQAGSWEQVISALTRAGGAAQRVGSAITPLDRALGSLNQVLAQLGQMLLPVVVSVRDLLRSIAALGERALGTGHSVVSLLAALSTGIAVARVAGAAWRALSAAMRAYAAATAAAQTMTMSLAGLVQSVIGIIAGVGTYYALETALARDIQEEISRPVIDEQTNRTIQELRQEMERAAGAAWAWRDALDGAGEAVERIQILARGADIGRLVRELAEGPHDRARALADLVRQIRAMTAMMPQGEVILGGVQMTVAEWREIEARAREALERETGRLQERIDLLRVEIDLRRRGLDDLAIEAEQMRRTRRELGLNVDLVDEWLRLERERRQIIADAEQREQKRRELERRAVELQRQLQTPLEEFEERSREVLDLWRQGLIKAETVQRWIAQERQRLAAAERPGSRLVAAMQRGSREAYSAIVQAMFRRRDQAAEKTARHAEEIARRLAEIQQMLAHQERL